MKICLHAELNFCTRLSCSKQQGRVKEQVWVSGSSIPAAFHLVTAKKCLKPTAAVQSYIKAQDFAPQDSK